MDPGGLGPEQWARIDRALASLSAFAGLVLTAGLALVLSRGILPSLASTDSGARRLRGARWLLDPIALLALALAVLALGRTLLLAAELLEQIQPRLLI
jgi:hypothetical protein